MLPPIPKMEKGTNAYKKTRYMYLNFTVAHGRIYILKPKTFRMISFGPLKMLSKNIKTARFL